VSTYKAHPAADGTWYVACHQAAGAMVVLKGVTEGQANSYAKVCNGEMLGKNPRQPHRRFGRFLLRKRVAMGLTLKEISHLVGVRNTTVSTWENALRMPGMQLLPNICRAYGVTAEELNVVISGGDQDI
jgi:DNA-binding XRE family transcriptional regulator